MMRGLILALLSLSATAALAETPWYVGAGIGMTNYQQGDLDEVTEASLDMDSWESGFSFFGGYQLDEHWAIELGYLDFGETDDYSEFAFELPPPFGFVGGGISYETTGIYLNGQYHIPVAKTVSLDLVGGWVFGEADAEEIFAPNTLGTPASATYNDNGAMLGLAFTWQMASGIGLRGTANYYMLDYDSTINKPWRLGADVIWNF